MTYCMILTTCPTKEEATALAAGLIEKKLAACVQLSDITSYYTWKEEVCNDPEVRMAIKTRQSLFQAVAQFIKTHHSYEVAQIVQIPVTDGARDYLDWIEENTVE